ncbi:hypothetical protein [Streptomyces venezuelae]|uniref:hypothetical protein n=1 Tax=Streptomyces venezuelae TaxID=54571 RepID=UPI003666EB4B
MNRDQWFEVEDPAAEGDDGDDGDDGNDGDEPWDFDADELAFIGALRDRADSWQVRQADGWVGRPEDDSSLLVCVSLLDDERNTVLGEWAVHFYGAYVRAGRVADQFYNVHEVPARLLSRAPGTPEELAGRCAEWFEAVLSRPVGRLEWVNEGGVYATTWLFADTGEALVTDNNLDRGGHSRCVLVRGAAPSVGGAAPRQAGPHAVRCPFRPAAPTTVGVGPSRIPRVLWRGRGGPT